MYLIRDYISFNLGIGTQKNYLTKQLYIYSPAARKKDFGKEYVV